jgi:hypothetical protein
MWQRIPRAQETRTPIGEKMPNSSQTTRYLQRITMLAAIAVLAACGGGGGDRACVSDPNRNPALPGCGDAPTVVATASSVQLLVSSQQLASDGTSTVGVTVIALDSGRVGVAGRSVSLSASDPAGAAYLSNFSSTATSGARVTDTNGQLTATLSTGGNKSNRAISLSVIVDGVSAGNTVNVVGTTLKVTGSNALAFNATTGIGMVLADSSGAPVGGAPISVTSALGNAIAPASVTTDASGKATVTVTGTKPGNDSVSFAAMGASASLAINVSSNSFAFAIPASGTTQQVFVNAPQSIVVRWTSSGSPVAGAAINFATTRGTLSASHAVTSSIGEAAVSITSGSPGPATITASSTTGGGVTATASVVFVISNTASTLDLQADKTTIPVNAAGSSASVANLYAVARDAADNVVPGATVVFHIDQDSTGGSLAAGTVVTDASGVARTQYVPTTVSSPTNGVVIRATLMDKSGATIATRTLQLTVGGQKVFVRIGTDNLVESVDANYVKKYSAFVTDAAGNPVSGAVVQFVLRPRQDIAFDPAQTGNVPYVMQFLQRDDNPPAGMMQSFDYAYGKGIRRWNGTVWAQVTSVNCFNEDVNANGILDPGEDYNRSGMLQPGNAFSVDGDVATNSSGYATARISYPKDHATWLTVTLKATARVAGTEGSESATFTLPIALQDVAVELASPPGRISPYGTSSSCADPF